MILCIFGSRTLSPTDSEIDYAISVCMEKKGWPKPTAIMSGMAPGVDVIAARYANRTSIRLLKMPADWRNRGRSAGFIRNGEMARIAEYFICFWDGESKGTAHMMRCVKVQNKPLHMIVWRKKTVSYLPELTTGDSDV